MINGLNFNGTQIPEARRRRFARRKKIDGMVAVLNGVCDTEEELKLMLAQASNGRRMLRTAARGRLFAVYVCY